MTKCHDCDAVARFVRAGDALCRPCADARGHDVPTPTLTQWSGANPADEGDA